MYLYDTITMDFLIIQFSYIFKDLEKTQQFIHVDLQIIKKKTIFRY